MNEIQFMKERTRLSSIEAEDVNCNRCYEIQERILSVTEKYFKSKSNQDI